MVRFGFMAGLGVLLVGLYFVAQYLMMDTSVFVPGGGKVHNIGLGSDRLIGIIISLSVCALGVVIMVVQRKR